MNNQIQKYKNCLKDQNVLIAGNGPSFSSLDLESIPDNITTLAVNKISLAYDKTEWRPDYYFCFSIFPLRDESWKACVVDATLNEKTTCFVPREYTFLQPKDNIVFIDNVLEHHRNGPIPENLFEINPEDHVVKSFTATTAVFQFCFYADVSRVALIGQDGYKKNSQNHFIDKYSNQTPTNFDKVNDRFKRLHAVIKNHADKNNIDIYNLSNQSVIDVYPYTTLGEYSNEQS